ncbi:MAG: hypothetical protein AB1Z31_07395 [Desulfobacterales bacterium]
MVHVVVLPVDIKLLLSFAGTVSSQGQSTGCPKLNSFNALLMFYLYTNKIQIVKNFFIKNLDNYQTVMFLPTKYSGDLNETNKDQRPATKCGCGRFEMLSSNPQSATTSRAGGMRKAPGRGRLCWWSLILTLLGVADFYLTV